MMFPNNHCNPRAVLTATAGQFLTARVFFVRSCLSFALKPCPYISRAVFESDAIRFAPCQKFHCIAIDQSDVLQVESYAMVNVFQAEKSLQLWDMLKPDSTNQS